MVGASNLGSWNGHWHGKTGLRESRQVWERLVMQKSKWPGCNRCWWRRSALGGRGKKGWGLAWGELEQALEDWNLVMFHCYISLLEGASILQRFAEISFCDRIEMAQICSNDSTSVLLVGKTPTILCKRDFSICLRVGSLQPNLLNDTLYDLLRKWDAGRPNIHCPHLECRISSGSSSLEPELLKIL